MQESFSLWSSQKWIKGVTKGDSILFIYKLNVPYSRKIWQEIKFSGLAVYLYNRQIKIHQYFLLTYMRVEILYQTTKFKSANIFVMVILGPTAKFISRQYFRLYSMQLLSAVCLLGVLASA